MSLEDRLQARQEDLAAARRIEPRVAECLSFAELSRPEPFPSAIEHLEQCDRCQTLRDRLLQAMAAESAQLTASVPRSSRAVRGVLWLSPLASAACLGLAMWVASGRTLPAGPENPDPLRQRVLDMAPVIDGAVLLLSDQPRGPTETDKLKAENQKLRDELRLLIERLEELLRLARTDQKPRAEGTP